MALGPLAMAVVPELVGGIFGLLGSRKKKQTGTDFVKLRNDAIAGGFNPLTALQATGGAAYSRADQGPVMSSLSFIGEALSSGLRSHFQRKLDREDRDYERKRDMQDWMAREEATPRYAASSFGVDAATAVEPIDLMVPYRRRDGSIFFGPNPLIPDNDQIFVPQMMEGMNMAPDINLHAGSGNEGFWSFGADDLASSIGDATRTPSTAATVRGSYGLGWRRKKKRVPVNTFAGPPPGSVRSGGSGAFFTFPLF